MPGDKIKTPLVHEPWIQHSTFFSPPQSFIFRSIYPSIDVQCPWPIQQFSFNPTSRVLYLKHWTRICKIARATRSGLIFLHSGEAYPIFCTTPNFSHNLYLHCSVGGLISSHKVPTNHIFETTPHSRLCWLLAVSKYLFRYQVITSTSQTLAEKQIIFHSGFQVSFLTVNHQ